MKLVGPVVVSLTDDQYKNFKDKFVPVSDDADTPNIKTSGVGEGEGGTKPSTSAKTGAAAAA